LLPKEKKGSEEKERLLQQIPSIQEERESLDFDFIICLFGSKIIKFSSLEFDSLKHK